MQNPASLPSIQLHQELTLNSPLISASGAFGFSLQASDLIDFNALGAFTTPTLTLQPRIGFPPPRTAESHSGLLLSSGWPNPGLKVFLAVNLPDYNSLLCPLIVNITAGCVEDWQALTAELSAEEGIAAIELNLSWDAMFINQKLVSPFPAGSEYLDVLMASITAVKEVSSKPIIAKLPSSGIEAGEAAKSAVEAGADIISISSGYPGIAVRAQSLSLKLANRYGNLSGPCIKPLALYQVWRAANSVEVPVIASGGIASAEDVLEFLLVGASAAAIGTACLSRPNAISEISKELRLKLNEMQVSDLKELIGAAK